MNVFRDPAKNQIVEMPRERIHHGNRRQELARRFDGDSDGWQRADGARGGGRPTAEEARQLLRELRQQAAAEGIEPPDSPAFEVTPLRGVAVDLG
jgi:hypothetical protein